MYLVYRSFAPTVPLQSPLKFFTKITKQLKLIATFSCLSSMTDLLFFNSPVDQLTHRETPSAHAPRPKLAVWIVNETPSGGRKRRCDYYRSRYESRRYLSDQQSRFVVFSVRRAGRGRTSRRKTGRHRRVPLASSHAKNDAVKDAKRAMECVLMMRKT